MYKGVLGGGAAPLVGGFAACALGGSGLGGASLPTHTHPHYASLLARKLGRPLRPRYARTSRPPSAARKSAPTLLAGQTLFPRSPRPTLFRFALRARSTALRSRGPRSALAPQTANFPHPHLTHATRPLALSPPRAVGAQPPASGLRPAPNVYKCKLTKCQSKRLLLEKNLQFCRVFRFL